MEPTITINGEQLSDGMAMTIRVAVESFDMDLLEGLGDDDHGRTMTQLYRDNINRIRALIHK